MIVAANERNDDGETKNVNQRPWYRDAPMLRHLGETNDVPSSDKLFKN